jgi:acetolactate synthase-1/2/3 large subunit
VSTAAPAALVQQAAAMLAQASNPVIIAQRGAGSAEGFATLGKLASDWGIPVLQYWAIQLAIATDHPMAVGSDPKAWLADADVVLAIDSLAPWSPQIHELPNNCKVIQLGPDPLYQRVPVRNFRADVSLAGEIAGTLTSLADAMRPLLAKQREARDLRRARVTDASRSLRKTIRSKAEAGNGAVMTKAWVSLCLSDAISGRNAAHRWTRSLCASMALGTRSRTPAGSAGHSRQVSACCWRSPSDSSSPPWATAPTCSPIRSRVTRSRKALGCRCWC